LRPANVKTYTLKYTKIIILQLYRCKTWSVTLNEEQTLGVVDNRVLRRICGPKGEKAEGDWKRMHNEELHKLYASPYTVGVIKSRKMRCTGCSMQKGRS
jgi:hypothetical protein